MEAGRSTQLKSIKYLNSSNCTNEALLSKISSGPSEKRINQSISMSLLTVFAPESVNIAPKMAWKEFSPFMNKMKQAILVLNNWKKLPGQLGRISTMKQSWTWCTLLLLSIVLKQTKDFLLKNSTQSSPSTMQDQKNELGTKKAQQQMLFRSSKFYF